MRQELKTLDELNKTRSFRTFIIVALIAGAGWLLFDLIGVLTNPEATFRDLLMPVLATISLTGGLCLVQGEMIELYQKLEETEDEHEEQESAAT